MKFSFESPWPPLIAAAVFFVPHSVLLFPIRKAFFSAILGACENLTASILRDSTDAYPSGFRIFVLKDHSSRG
jgi:hypothetical protein